MLLRHSLLAPLLLRVCHAQQVSVVGPPVAAGQALPARRNVNDLHSQGGADWNIFIQALIALQEQNETDQLSYFQLMGIHGAPYKSWAGVEGVGGGGYGGYCCHGDVCFGLWHRPFLSLYEQTLYTHAQRIAGSYRGGGAAAYREAARNLRLPYWDWAADARLPAAATQRTVAVTTPQGRQTVRNPLRSYRFKRPLAELGMPDDAMARRFSETRRGPRADGGDDDLAAVDAELERYGPTLRSQVYNVFTQTTTFAQMATDAFPGSSFESPHNAVHNIAGAGGHLMWLDWSAFDPIFALHHCNVDRLVALWQALHPDEAVLNGSAPTNGQFATAPGPFTADSPLRPFRAGAGPGNFHTSRSVADVAALGYTYPELAAAPADDDLRRLVRARVNALYGGAASSSSSSSSSSAAAFAVSSSSSSSANATAPASGTDYQLQVRARREALDLPCRIEVAVGARAVGEVHLMASPARGLSFTVLPLDRDVLGTEGAVGGGGGVAALLERGLTLQVHKYDGSPSYSAASLDGVQLEVQERAYTTARDQAAFPNFDAAVAVVVQPPDSRSRRRRRHVR